MQAERTTDLMIRDFEAAELLHARFRKTWLRTLPAVACGTLVGVMLVRGGDVLWGLALLAGSVGYLAMFPVRLRRAARRKFGELLPEEHRVTFSYDDAGVRLAVGSEFRESLPWEKIVAVCRGGGVTLLYPPAQKGATLCHIVPPAVIESEADFASNLASRGVPFRDLG